MNEQRRLIVVDSSVLPEVILKVLAVKKLLASREEKSSASACKRIGISRSAYYKYRDSVFSYDDKMTKRILTLSALLRDEPGILSSVLVTLHACEANILTVNQNIPMDGVAAVTISLRLSGGNESSTFWISASFLQAPIRTRSWQALTRSWRIRRSLRLQSAWEA